jgi:hypothetical protein
MTCYSWFLGTGGIGGCVMHSRAAIQRLKMKYLSNSGKSAAGRFRAIFRQALKLSPEDCWECCRVVGSKKGSR